MPTSPAIDDVAARFGLSLLNYLAMRSIIGPPQPSYMVLSSRF